MRHFFSRQLLGRHVSGSSAADLSALNLIGDTRQAEISDHDLPASIEHDVRGLQVAVEHAFGVGGGQSGAELAGDIERLIFGQTADAAQQRREILAIDVFHGEEGVALDVAHVVDAANVGMRNPPRDPHFIFETLQQTLIAGGFIGKKLERHRLAEREVVGAIHLAHAAFSQQSNDAIATSQQAAGYEAAFAEIFRRTRGP